jgi:hypothetical protein
MQSVPYEGHNSVSRDTAYFIPNHKIINTVKNNIVISIRDVIGSHIDRFIFITLL